MLYPLQLALDMDGEAWTLTKTYAGLFDRLQVDRRDRGLI
jgi:hypothetical protein